MTEIARTQQPSRRLCERLALLNYFVLSLGSEDGFVLALSISLCPLWSVEGLQVVLPQGIGYFSVC